MGASIQQQARQSWLYQRHPIPHLITINDYLCPYLSKQQSVRCVWSRRCCSLPIVHQISVRVDSGWLYLYSEAASESVMADCRQQRAVVVGVLCSGAAGSSWSIRHLAYIYTPDSCLTTDYATHIVSKYWLDAYIPPNSNYPIQLSYTCSLACNIIHTCTPKVIPRCPNELPCWDGLVVYKAGCQYGVTESDCVISVP